MNHTYTYKNKDTKIIFLDMYTYLAIGVRKFKP